MSGWILAVSLFVRVCLFVSMCKLGKILQILDMIHMCGWMGFIVLIFATALALYPCI